MINVILWNSIYDCKNCIKNIDDKLCYLYYFWWFWNVFSRLWNVCLDIKIYFFYYEGKKSIDDVYWFDMINLKDIIILLF